MPARRIIPCLDVLAGRVVKGVQFRDHRDTGRRTLDWVREATERGAGEIVLNCMRRDGVRTGYDIAHTNAVADAVTVPVIASGGAGAPEHFRDAFVRAGASGALAATVFHDRLIAIPALKEYLASCAIEMRL